MSTATLETVLEQVKELTPDEQQKVRELLDSLGAEPKPQMTLEEVEHQMVEDGLLRRIPLVTEEEFLKILLARGVIHHLPSRQKNSSEDRRLIEVKGKPLSETIIEERR